MSEDIIGSAIEAMKSNTLEHVKDLMASNKYKSHAKMAVALGEIIAEGKSDIASLNIKDPRIDAALSELEDVFAKVARGEDPFRDAKPEIPANHRLRIVIDGSMRDMTSAQQEEVWRLTRTFDVFEKDVNGVLWQILDLSNPDEEYSNLIIRKT